VQIFVRSAALRKTTYPSVLAFLVLGSTAPTLTLAEALTKANQKDVAMLLDAATGMNSAYSALLIGETHDRVYFEYLTGIHASSLFTNRPKRVVYWLPRSEITDEQLTQFRAYKDRSTKAYRGGQTPGQ